MAEDLIPSRHPRFASLFFTLSCLHRVEVSGHSGVGTASFVFDGLILGTIANSGGEAP
jgi:hypothetical protein